jgi:hypothetical protein
LSVSVKLADFESTWELLSRLSLDELKLLAQRNSIVLQKEDGYGNVQKARSKEEAIDVLVASEFRESDIVELLGVDRLTKEEMLYVMSTRQLQQLAKETGVLLEKSTLFWTKKAIKKKDVVNALKVLSEQKVREYSLRIGLIKKATKKTKKRKPTKAPLKKPSKKAVARKKARKAKAAKPSIKETFHQLSKPALIEKEKPAPIVVPFQRAQTKTASIIEVIIRERLIEREVVRRQLALGKHREESGEKKKEAEKIVVEAKKAKKNT